MDDNYIRMLRAILNRSWKQHPTKQQLYGQLPPITKTIQIRRTRHAGHCRDKLISDVLLWTPAQLERTYSSSVMIRGVALRIWRKRWQIGRGGEKGSGISLLMAQQDDDNEINMIWFGWVGFYGISTTVDYLILNPLYTYILIYMIWFGWVLWLINHCRLFNAKSFLYIY